MPLDLGSKESCMIGGNLSTNAGGLKLIRHNSLHANTIGLKAVLANGTILDNMTTLRKDNTGFDLKQLFIGAEGALGLITECAIMCPALAVKKNVAIVGLNSCEDVFKLMQKTKSSIGDILYSFEMMDRVCMENVLECSVGAQYPFSEKYACYVLIETGSTSASGTDGEDPDLERLYSLFEEAGDLIADGTVAQDLKQFQQIWYLRENAAPAGINYGYVSILLKFYHLFVAYYIELEIRCVYAPQGLLQGSRCNA